MSDTFREALSDRVIVFDGAMGTEIYKHGVFINRCYDELNLSQPDIVAAIHNEYRKAGDLAQAIAICRQHLADQPGHMSGHIVYGQALFENKDFGEAHAVFEAALALDPENLIALRHLGDIARDRGEFATARTWYQRVLDADPRNEDIAAQMTLVAEAGRRRRRSPRPRPLQPLPHRPPPPRRRRSPPRSLPRRSRRIA